MATASDSSVTSDDDIIEVYNPATPWIQTVTYKNKSVLEYLPIQVDLIKFSPSFALPQVGDATASALLELFFPDSVLQRFVESTNNYSAF